MFSSFNYSKAGFGFLFKIDKVCYQQYSDEQKQRIIDSQPIFSQLDLQFYSMIDHLDEDGIPVIKAGLHLARTPIEDLDEVFGISH